MGKSLKEATASIELTLEGLVGRMSGRELDAVRMSWGAALKSCRDVPRGVVRVWLATGERGILLEATATELTELRDAMHASLTQQGLADMPLGQLTGLTAEAVEELIAATGHLRHGEPGALDDERSARANVVFGLLRLLHERQSTRTIDERWMLFCHVLRDLKGERSMLFSAVRHSPAGGGAWEGLPVMPAPGGAPGGPEGGGGPPGGPQGVPGGDAGAAAPGRAGGGGVARPAPGGAPGGPEGGGGPPGGPEWPLASMPPAGRA